MFSSLFRRRTTLVVALAILLFATSQTRLSARPAADIDWPTFDYKLRLDRAWFSPTLCDDNAEDPRYIKAIKAFQEARGLIVDGVIGPETSGTLRSYGAVTRTYTVTGDDLERIYVLPNSWYGQSLMPTLAFESVLEMLAERYHTSRDFMRRLNPDYDWKNVRAGDKVIVPRIRRPRPDFYAGRVVIDVGERGIRVWDEKGKLRAYFNCSIGRNKKVYTGLTLSIVTAAENPTYTLRPEVLGLEDQIDHPLVLPPGPNNPVGSWWVGLNRKGYGIHGSPDPERISQTESHGCIRLPNYDAMHFFWMAKVGCPVEFVNAPADSAATAGEDEEDTFPLRPKEE